MSDHEVVEYQAGDLRIMVMQEDVTVSEFDVKIMTHSGDIDEPGCIVYEEGLSEIEPATHRNAADHALTFLHMIATDVGHWLKQEIECIQEYDQEDIVEKEYTKNIIESMTNALRIVLLYGAATIRSWLNAPLSLVEYDDHRNTHFSPAEPVFSERE